MTMSVITIRRKEIETGKHRLFPFAQLSISLYGSFFAFSKRNFFVGNCVADFCTKLSIFHSTIGIQPFQIISSSIFLSLVDP